MKLLEKHFEIALETPDGIARLRELILKLAMQGKLVPQNSNDKPAKELINEIVDAKQKIVGKKKNKSTSTLVTEDEILFQLPNNWIWCRLDQITEYIQRGKGPVYSEIEEIPVISQKCVQWSGFNKNVVKFISPESINKYQPERFIRKGDLLWNSTGTGTLGRINCYNDELKEFSIVVADSHVTVVRPLKVNSSYILYFLKSPYVQETIEANASGTTNQIELNTSTVMNQVIPLPPFEEQKRIVEKIDQLMLLCDKLEAERDRKNKLQLQINSAAINKLIKANDEISFNKAWSFIASQFDTLYTTKQNVTDLKNTILELGVTGKLNFSKNASKASTADDLLFEIYEEKNKLIQQKKYRKQDDSLDNSIEELNINVPENWKSCRIKDIGFVLGGKRLPKGHSYSESPTQYRYITVTNMKKNTVIDNDIKYIDKTTRDTIRQYTISKEDIYITIAGTIGAVGEIPEALDNMNLTENACKLVFFKCDKQFLIYLLNSNFVQSQFNTLTNKLAQPKLSLRSILSTSILLPPIEEQNIIVKKVNHLFKLCDKLEKNIEQSSKKQVQILNAVLAQV